MNAIAQTIVAQLGNQTFAMMGAKNLVFGAKMIQFRIRGAFQRRKDRPAPNLVQIHLDEATDTYDVFTYYVRGTTVKQIDSVRGVYVESLHDVLETATGLFTRM